MEIFMIRGKPFPVKGLSREVFERLPECRKEGCEMGTKNNPGKFDCYANAEPDEPMFILLGRDPMAGALVRHWARMRQKEGEDVAKVEEALECAAKMDAWALKKGKSPKDVIRLWCRELVEHAANIADMSHAREKAETLRKFLEIFL